MSRPVRTFDDVKAEGKKYNIQNVWAKKMRYLKEKL